MKATHRYHKYLKADKVIITNNIKLIKNSTNNI